MKRSVWRIKAQINLLQDLQKYMQNEGYEVLPSNIGLQDVNLAAAINRYNDVLVERKRLLRTSTENNPTIINLDTSIHAMKRMYKSIFRRGFAWIVDYKGRFGS